MRYVLAIAASLCVWAQAGLERPVIGQMLDREGVLRRVTGLGGSFQLDPGAERRVLATACSRELCVAKTDAAVVSGMSSTPAPSGGAFIGIDGSGALLYFRSGKQFARWQNGAVTSLDISVDGEVLALRSVNSIVSLAIRRESGVWIVAGNGTILDSLPADTGAVLMLPDSLVYSIGEELVLRRADGAEVRFAASGVIALFAMGQDYVEALTSRSAYALRTAVGREGLYVLPHAPGRARPR